MLTGAYRMQRVSLSLTFLERYHKGGDEFLIHIAQVTGDENWFYLSMLKPKSSQQSKQ
jgi:hypothetical protein